MNQPNFWGTTPTYYPTNSPIPPCQEWGDMIANLTIPQPRKTINPNQLTTINDITYSYVIGNNSGGSTFDSLFSTSGLNTSLTNCTFNSGIDASNCYVYCDNCTFNTGTTITANNTTSSNYIIQFVNCTFNDNVTISLDNVTAIIQGTNDNTLNGNTLNFNLSDKSIVKFNTSFLTNTPDPINFNFSGSSGCEIYFSSLNFPKSVICNINVDEDMFNQDSIITSINLNNNNIRIYSIQNSGS